MRQCPQCYRVYGADIAYCLNDGSLLSNVRDQEETIARTAFIPAKPQSKKRDRTTIAAVLLLLLPLVVILTFSAISNLKRTNQTAATTYPTYTPEQTVQVTPQLGRTPRKRSASTPEPTVEPTHTSAPLAVSITPEFVQLEPNQYKLYPFLIGSNGGRVEGSFSAQGGLGNDVYVYVIAENELAAFRNGYSFRQYYDSGKVQSDNFRRDLPSGSYFVILKSPTPFTARRIRCNLNTVSN
jgi:hypothetical protein